MSEVHFGMVSEWMANGNVNEFVKANPDAERLKLVCFCPESCITLFAPGSLAIA